MDYVCACLIINQSITNQFKNLSKNSPHNYRDNIQYSLLLLLVKLVAVMSIAINSRTKTHTRYTRDKCWCLFLVCASFFLFFTIYSYTLLTDNGDKKRHHIWSHANPKNAHDKRERTQSRIFSTVGNGQPQHHCYWPTHNESTSTAFIGTFPWAVSRICARIEYRYTNK